APLQLRFTISCARVPAALARVEELLERVRDACRDAQRSGGARSGVEREEGTVAEPDEDPRQRLLRALLQATEFGGVVRFGFQPLLPVTGLIAGIYDGRAALQ